MIKSNISPMMRQYFEIKEQNKDSLLFYRLGDFYEMFYDDAVLGSKLLNITLTARDAGNNERAPMCGVPYHSSSSYISKLLALGKKIAICEQIGEVKQGSKKPLHRKVVRILTPGTVVSCDYLPQVDNNFIACIYCKNNNLAISWMDVSTGEFYKKELAYIKELNNILTRILPKEIICCEDSLSIFSSLPCIKAKIVPNITPISNQINTEGYNPKSASDFASVILLEYVLKNTKDEMPFIETVQEEVDSTFLNMDYNTRKNLELTQNMHDTKSNGTLYHLLNKTITAMGARKLKNWIEKPSTNISTIIQRHDAVDKLLLKRSTYESLKNILHGFPDIERIANRLSNFTLSPRDDLALCQSLEKSTTIFNLLDDLNCTFFDDIKYDFDINGDIIDIIKNTISDNPPSSIRETGIIREGYNLELDKYRLSKNEKNEFLQNFEKEIKQELGIKNAKIGYSKLIGYYIEIPKNSSINLPQEYIRKQTVSSGERYTNKKLLETENEILDSKDNIMRLECMLYLEHLKKLGEYLLDLRNLSKAISILDCILSLVEVAKLYNLSKPIMVKENVIDIKEGKHPLVDNIFDKDNYFVPNDTYLDTDENRILLLTGPNMAGKSVYMKQIAIICIMAQMGSFVPAANAKLCIVDKIFTRIGAADDLSRGQSTFMMEMNEVSEILKYATKNSLVLLDEVGRGTSTLDGMSIAWALIEYLCKAVKAKTIFSTHYHELTELEGLYNCVKNYKMSLKEVGREIVFLRKLQRGSIEKSFGIEVAALAGVPEDVISRAKAILENLKKVDFTRNIYRKKPISQEDNDSNKEVESFVKELENLDLDLISPKQAMDFLYYLKKKYYNKNKNI